jgi:HEAT repeat protein
MFFLMPGFLLANGGLSSKDGQNVVVGMMEDRDGALRLEARQASWRQVFDRIASETGVQVHYSALPPVLITATCAGATVKQVVECLLGPNANLIFRYPRGLSGGDLQGQPVEAWVMGITHGAGQRPAGVKDGGPCLTAGAQGDGGRPRPIDASTRREPVAPDPELAETLVRTAGSEDPTKRVSALSQLAVERPVDPGIVQEILQTALSDKDPNVRGQAVYAVVRRGGVDAAAVLQDALRDSALPVRLMAVDGLGIDEESIALLKQALADSDQAVRELAAMKLKSLSTTHGIR